MKNNFIFLHGYSGSAEGVFFPWLKKELEIRGLEVQAPNLPNPENPTEEEQVNFCLDNLHFDENSFIVAHSLGCFVALKVVEKLPFAISGLLLAGGFIDPNFKDKPRIFEDKFSWNVDAKRVKENSKIIKLLHDPDDYAVSDEQAKRLSVLLEVPLTICTTNEPHFTGSKEPDILNNLPL